MHRVMTVFDVNSVFRLIGAFNFGNGHHDDIVIVTIGNQLVSATFYNFTSAFEKFKGGSRIALNKHVTTSCLFCKIHIMVQKNRRN